MAEETVAFAWIKRPRAALSATSKLLLLRHDYGPQPIVISFRADEPTDRVEKRDVYPHLREVAAV